MNNYEIPFNRPFLSGKELYYIAQAVFSGHTAGDGKFSKKCQRFMEEKFGAKNILLTPSCTAALEMAALLCQVKPGDEVVMPSFTFVSTANAFYLRGAKLVFVDIKKDTLNIDETKIDDVISKDTKVIVPVHYAGVGCEMDYIMPLAKERKILVVEDAAQGVNAKYKGKFLGTIGDIGTYSFHETKNFICGEGGAIILNNDGFFERAEIIREKGTDRIRLIRGEVDRYAWVDVGSSYVLSDLLAGFLYAQLENMDQINRKREEIWNFYHRSLIPLANDGLLRLPYIPPESNESNSHLFYIILQNEETRNKLMEHLKIQGIYSVFHYIPLHLSPIGKSMGYKEGDLPVTESISGRLLRLPFYYEMTCFQQDRVVEEIKKVLYKHSGSNHPV